MTATNQSPTDRGMLPFSSAGGSLLFRTSNDLMTSILSYLCIKSICQLDIAATNTAARIIWLSSLRATNHGAISKHNHDHESIRWLVRRRISPDCLTTCGNRAIARRVDGSSLLSRYVITATYLLRQIWHWGWGYRVNSSWFSTSHQGHIVRLRLYHRYEYDSSWWELLSVGLDRYQSMQWYTR